MPIQSPTHRRLEQHTRQTDDIASGVRTGHCRFTRAARACHATNASQPSEACPTRPSGSGSARGGRPDPPASFLPNGGRGDELLPGRLDRRRSAGHQGAPRGLGGEDERHILDLHGHTARHCQQEQCGQLGWLRCGACSGRGNRAGAPTSATSSRVNHGSLAPLRAREGSLGSGQHGSAVVRWLFGPEIAETAASNLSILFTGEENGFEPLHTFYRRRKSAREHSPPFCGFRGGVPVLAYTEYI